MKVSTILVCNRLKTPHTHEEINPVHIVRVVKVKIEEKESFVPAYKLFMSNNYCLIVDERDYKKVIQ